MTNSIGAKLKPTMEVTADKITLKIKQSTTGFKVTGLAKGDSIKSITLNSNKYVKLSNVNLKKGTCKLTALKKKDEKGTTKLTIKLASGITKVIPITVQTKAVKTTAIKNVEKTLKMEIKDKIVLKPVVVPFTSADGLKYTSSNKKIATVSKSGVITAKKAGKATITVKSGKKTVKVKVTVLRPALTGIGNVAATKTLRKGKTFTIRPKVVPTGAEAKFTYSSSDSKVASVTKKGKVIAKKAGTAIITVKAGKFSKKCKVTVK